MKRSKRWTKEEEEFLINNYPKNGSYFCSENLNRTKEAIVLKAGRLKINRDGDTRYNRKIAPKGYIYCSVCDQILEEGKFYRKNKKGKYGKKIQLCRSCNQKRARKNYNINKSSAIKRLHSTPEKTIFNRIKARARQKNIEFDLTINDIIIPDFCPVLNIPILLFSHSHNSPSIDRLDPNKGYIKGNIKIISKRANLLKSNATSEELYQVYLYTKKHFK